MKITVSKNGPYIVAGGVPIIFGDLQRNKPLDFNQYLRPAGLMEIVEEKLFYDKTGLMKQIGLMLNVNNLTIQYREDSNGKFTDTQSGGRPPANPEEFRAYHHRLPTGSGNLGGLDGSTHVGRQHRCRCKGGDAL